MSVDFLCHIDDIEESHSKSFPLDNDRELFIIKKDGQIFAYENRCPHLGIELNWVEHQFLDIEQSLIQCSTHGALFLIESGECISGPCLRERLTRVPLVITMDGKVCRPP